MDSCAEGVARELAAIGAVRTELGKRTLLATRATIQHGWQAVAEKLVLHGDRQFAEDVALFADGMNRPFTDREWLAKERADSVRARPSDVRTL